ncbi:MAG: cyclase family protein, partial [Oscillospiraceae bacterium]
MLVHDLTHHNRRHPRLARHGAAEALEGSTFERDGFRETRLGILHVGTHMDAPAHMRVDRPQLDELPASAFCGTAFVLDARGCAPGGEVPAEAVEGAAGADFLLVCTGWDRFWNTPEYFGRFPVLSEAAVRRAVELGVKGIGLDTMGIDPMDAEGFPRHHIMFENSLV